MQPPQPYFPPAPPPRRGNLPLVLALVVLGAVLVVLAAIVAVVLAQRKTTPPGALKTSLQFREVTTTTPSACTGGGVTSVDGDACYQLAGGMTVTRVKEIKLVPPDAAHGGLTYSVEIALLPADAGRLGTLTADAARQRTPRNQLAIVVGGKVISAPAVQEPITGGTLEIAGDFSKAKAQRYIDLMEG